MIVEFFTPTTVTMSEVREFLDNCVADGIAGLALHESSTKITFSPNDKFAEVSDVIEDIAYFLGLPGNYTAEVTDTAAFGPVVSIEYHWDCTDMNGRVFLNMG